MVKKFAVSSFFLFSLVLVLASSVFADHPYSAGRHLISQHAGAINEVYCADVKNANNTTLTSAKTRLDDLDWNYYSKIVFWEHPRNTVSCRDMSASDLSDISIRYYIYTSTSNVSPCYGSSCISFRGGQTLTHSETGGTATDYSYVILTILEANMGATHTINHETGHALGLVDGSGTCPDSIMHSKAYGCSTNRALPSDLDKETVNEEADEETYLSN